MFFFFCHLVYILFKLLQSQDGSLFSLVFVPSLLALLFDLVRGVRK